jgi:hypothetical protein
LKNALSLLGRSDSIDPMRKGRLLLVGLQTIRQSRISNLPDGMDCVHRTQVIYRWWASSSFK